MASLLKEIWVLEVSLYVSGFTNDAHSTAGTFHTAVGKAGQHDKRESVCTYCKGLHTANQCTVIKDHQRRTSIVKSGGLCYNCLAHHKVSQCPSCRRCEHCNQKHHTSLCPPAPVVAPTNNPPPALNTPTLPALSATNVQPPPAPSLIPNTLQPQPVAVAKTTQPPAQQTSTATTSSCQSHSC